MRKFRYCISVLIATLLLFSMPVFAGDIGFKSSTEPVYKIIPGLVTMDESPKSIVLDNNSMAVNSFEVKAISLAKRKPDKEMKFIYTVIKATELAVIQNQNFDRVSI